MGRKYNWGDLPISFLSRVLHPCLVVCSEGGGGGNAESLCVVNTEQSGK